jgi:predicted dinucleotide-binding enzyme
MSTLGIIGAGHIGGQVARVAIAHGHEVVIANSRGPETLAGLVAELGPRARAATSAEAASAGDAVLVSVPLGAYHRVPVEPLAGKVVLDTANYYWERDGHISELDDGTATVTGLLQAHLPSSRVAKAFNAIRFTDITADARPSGDPERRALATASDFEDAADFVARLYDEFGFDTVNIGPLSESWRVDRDQPAYGARANATELSELLAAASR